MASPHISGISDIEVLWTSFPTILWARIILAIMGVTMIVTRNVVMKMTPIPVNEERSGMSRAALYDCCKFSLVLIDYFVCLPFCGCLG